MRFVLMLAVLTTTLASAAMTAGSPVHVGAAQTNVDVGNFYFCAQSFQGGVCETAINTGDTVAWSVSAGTHTVTECDVNYATCPTTGGFDSSTLSQGQQFQRTFNTAGTFYYECTIHPQAMRGRVLVQAVQATATPTPTASASPTVAPTTRAFATPTQTPAAVPATGGLPSGQAPSAELAVIVAGTLMAIAGAAAAYRAWRLGEG